jgi:hypothetical protein
MEVQDEEKIKNRMEKRRGRRGRGKEANQKRKKRMEK